MAGQRHHRSRGWKLFLAAVWCFLHFSRISDPALAVNPSLPSNPSDKASALRTNLQKLTVKQLQAQLREKGLTVSGRKAALVDRLLAVSEKLPDPSRVDSEQFTGEDRDWEDKILATGDYSSVLPPDAMPFVNRQYELFQLLRENIDAILMLLDGEVTDFRRLRVCFSAQMFGAGKTTLGKNFLSQINSEAFEVYAHEMISNRSQNEQKDWVAEWQRAKEARQLYVDVHECGTIEGVLNEVSATGNITTPPRSGEPLLRFAEVIFTIASQRPDRALFVHIDELGELGNDVSLIRNGVRATWKRMNKEREKEMPRIYFFLSGKGIPIEAIGKATSPVGTRWILLDHLHQEHITEILQHLQTSAGLQLGCNFTLLAKKLYFETGGAPRMLLYTIRCLHHLGYDMTDEENMDSAIAKAYEKLCSVAVVTSDLFISNMLGVDLKNAWLLLLIFGEFGVEVNMLDEIDVNSRKLLISDLLRHLNIYITRDGMKTSENFRIQMFDFVRRFAQRYFARNAVVPLFYKIYETPAVDAARLLEGLVWQRLLARHACGLTEWRELLPMLKNSRLAPRTALLNKPPVRTCPKITEKSSNVNEEMSEADWLERKTLRPQDFSNFMTAVSPNYLYIPSSMSKSADTIVSQQEWKLELQQKAFTSTQLSFSTLLEEINKSLPEPHNVTLVFIALSIAQELEHWANETDDGILTLTAGDYAFSKDDRKVLSRTLLFRPFGSQDWQQLKNGGKASRRDVETRLTIRSGMEVIIPSVKVVQTFLGQEDVEQIRQVARGDRVANLPLVSQLFSPGSQGKPTAPIRTAAIWVRQLRKEEDGKIKEADTSPFKIKESVADVDDLKDAIKKKEELSIAASKLEVHSFKDGRWEKENVMSKSLRDTDESDCYGYLLPS